MEHERKIDPEAMARVLEASRRLQAVLEGKLPPGGPKCGRGTVKEIQKYAEELRKKEVSVKDETSGAGPSSNPIHSLHPEPAKVVNLKRKSPGPKDRGNDSEASTDVDDLALKRQKTPLEDVAEEEKKMTRKRRQGKGAKKRRKGKKKATTPAPGASGTPAELWDNTSGTTTMGTTIMKNLIAHQSNREIPVPMPVSPPQDTSMTVSHLYTVEGIPRTTEPFPPYQESPEGLSRYIRENFPQTFSDHLFHSSSLNAKPLIGPNTIVPSLDQEDVEREDQEMSALVYQHSHEAYITTKQQDVQMQDQGLSVPIHQSNQQAYIVPIQQDTKTQYQEVSYPIYQLNKQAYITPMEQTTTNEAPAIPQTNFNMPATVPTNVPAIFLNDTPLELSNSPTMAQAAPALMSPSSLCSLLASCGFHSSSTSHPSPLVNTANASSLDVERPTLLPSVFDELNREIEEARSTPLPEEWVQAEKEDEADEDGENED